MVKCSTPFFNMRRLMSVSTSSLVEPSPAVASEASSLGSSDTAAMKRSSQVSSSGLRFFQMLTFSSAGFTFIKTIGHTFHGKPRNAEAGGDATTSCTRLPQFNSNIMVKIKLRSLARCRRCPSVNRENLGKQ